MERGRACARTRRRDRPESPGNRAKTAALFGFFELLKEQMFVFWFKKNGFSVPFLGLKPFQTAYVCGGKGFFFPAFPSPRTPYPFARVLHKRVIVCITLIGEGGRAQPPPRRSGGAYFADFFGRSVAVARPAARCTGPRSV